MPPFPKFRLLPLGPLLALGTLIALLGGSACADPKEPPVNQPKENRLAKERSPYLRQHRLNPVDWYPWGEEALARAKREDKPIFLSIGYAACHWCHVMEHESFEDEETARLLNAAFVCVKVDREERPDLDRVYMTAVQVASRGRGGWPMTVIMTPETKPFFARTYLSREQLRQVTAQIDKLWKSDRAQLEGYADSLSEAIQRSVDDSDAVATDDTDAEIFKTLENSLGARFDNTYGGFGSRPKFPPHAELLYHLHGDGGRMTDDTRHMVYTTLDALARGGIHDQVGGGFHRYSTDAKWLLPHFEKMLYDNALLARAYARAYALTKRPRYRRVVERLFDWLEREMLRPKGGYASSLDADTEGEEGVTYTWSQGQLQAALASKDAAFLETLFGVEARGNFSDEASGHRNGQNILHWTRSLTELAQQQGVAAEALLARIDGLFLTLRKLRDKRPQPGLDDKVITGWNGLLLSAFAHAGSDLGEPRWLERGRRLATYLLKASRREDGTLLRFPQDSGPEIPAFCEDYVHLIDGLLDLAVATGESRWSEAAAELTARLDAEFQDTASGGFFATSATKHETLLARAKESFDSPIPSDNGTAARVNLRLHATTGGEAYREAAERTLSLFRPAMANARMNSGVVALIDALRLQGELARAKGTAPARGDLHVRQGVVQVDVFLSRAQAAPGSSVPILVRVHIDTGWHVNAHEPTAPDLVGTALSAVAGPHAVLKDVRYPPGGAAYAGRFDLPAVLVVSADTAPGRQGIPLELRVQPCNESSCLAPMTLRLDVSLLVAESDGSATHAALFPRGK